MKPEEIGPAWSAFMRDAIGDRNLTNLEIGDLVGVSESMVGNWLNATGSQPNGKNVIEFARKFGRPIPKALVAAGYGEEREYSETVVVPRDVSEMSVDEMIDHMVIMLARIREIADAAAPDSGGSRRRKRKYWPRPDVEPI